MTIYLFNTLITPINFEKHKKVTIELEKIDVFTACNILRKEKFYSVVGHEGTAKVIEGLCGVKIPVNRESIYMEPGDEGIHFFLKHRLPEGKILSDEELKHLDFWFVRSRVKE